MQLLSAVMDRVIPPVDDLPGAGSMGLATEVVQRSSSDERFNESLRIVLALLPSDDDFEAMDEVRRDQAIALVEESDPANFGLWLDVVYTVYYMQPQVHQRLGWHGRPPQPEGNQMPPWDESVLGTVRKREPFWRRV